MADIAIDMAQEGAERNAFRVQCPACQRVYLGTWSASVRVQLIAIDCVCKVVTQLSHSAKSSSSGTAADQVIGTAEAGHSPSAGEKP